ncbi:MAG: methylated-DNA--[protein]-cysteine S-methyltransferase [Lentisphaeria bacterium]|nr:methylated-DNA--[protein]-cysteine S-methyltransferase [Lentisphaeria bacterium]NQZ69598.1 methylated-DNA--[protein]-cysteine S-methyltransferase [Lentisphaeria bacterium]
MNTYYLKCDMGVVQIDWMDELIYGIGLPKKMKAKKSIPISAALKDTVKNLEKLFDGKDTAFDFDLLHFEKTGTFTHNVYKTVFKIPAGKTLSYKEVAKKSGNEKASRAVGSAMAKNPFPLIVPCHRVLAAGGKAGGFDGGIPMKRDLLKLENTDVAF